MQTERDSLRDERESLKRQLEEWEDMMKMLTVERDQLAQVYIFESSLQAQNMTGMNKNIYIF